MSVSLRLRTLPRRAFDRRSPRAPEIDAAEQEQPHHVDEVPVPGRELKAEVMPWGELAGKGAEKTYGEENDADYDMRTVEPGRHEEGRPVDRVFERERRVDILVSLRHDE